MDDPIHSTSTPQRNFDLDTQFIALHERYGSQTRCNIGTIKKYEYMQ